MRRNFARWMWDDDWKCTECEAPAGKAMHYDRDGNVRTGPYNARQVTCSPECAQARKTRLQNERRELARQPNKKIE